MNFTASYESFGANVTHELKPGGADTPVTKANREEFVRASHPVPRPPCHTSPPRPQSPVPPTPCHTSSSLAGVTSPR
jgi:hypothetical protein